MFKQVKLKFFTVLALALIALIFYLAPAQIPVVLHKFAQVTLAAVLGYWLDRHIFPENRPSDWMGPGTVAGVDELRAYGTATLRRAIIVAATEIAVAIAI